MSQYRDSNSGSLASLISGAVLGAAGLAWWLLSEAEKRQETRKQKQCFMRQEFKMAQKQLN